jgi:glycosyltransferase involved in cell wall biosynthesis
LPIKSKKKKLSQKRLREIAWEIGHGYPVIPSHDTISLSMVRPRLGHVHWYVRSGPLEEFHAALGETFRKARLLVRVYDVTDIIFDGSNAHFFFDIETGRLDGNHYFGFEHTARNCLAELGLRSPGGAFRALIRSNTVFFDRDRPSGNYRTSGLFSGGSLARTFPVENIFDAPLYETLNRELEEIDRDEALSVAVVLNGFDKATGYESALGSYIRNVSDLFRNFGGDVRFFPSKIRHEVNENNKSLQSAVAGLSRRVFSELRRDHRKKPFHIIHCHEWYSSRIGIQASEEFGLPFVLSLHSTEYERMKGNEISRLSAGICEREKEGIQKADLVIVPHSSTRQQVITMYGAADEKVVIIPDTMQDCPAGAASPSEVRLWFGIRQNAPLVLFAGEMSHAGGADLLLDAIPTVCRNHPAVQFVFAGEGPLRKELEGRAWAAGAGHRCRFLGDIARETFEALLAASDFVVIPARTWQDEGLAQAAIQCGKPVLTTRQAGIGCVRHGETGLVTFDNPGSIVWGVQELLFSPLKDRMVRYAARRAAAGPPSVENVSVQHYIYYETVLKRMKGSTNA